MSRLSALALAATLAGPAAAQAPMGRAAAVPALPASGIAAAGAAMTPQQAAAHRDFALSNLSSVLPNELLAAIKEADPTSAAGQAMLLPLHVARPRLGAPSTNAPEDVLAHAKTAAAEASRAQTEALESAMRFVRELAAREGREAPAGSDPSEALEKLQRDVARFAETVPVAWAWLPERRREVKLMMAYAESRLAALRTAAAGARALAPRRGDESLETAGRGAADAAKPDPAAQAAAAARLAPSERSGQAAAQASRPGVPSPTRAEPARFSVSRALKVKPSGVDIALIGALLGKVSGMGTGLLAGIGGFAAVLPVALIGLTLAAGRIGQRFFNSEILPVEKLTVAAWILAAAGALAAGVWAAAASAAAAPVLAVAGYLSGLALVHFERWIAYEPHNDSLAVGAAAFGAAFALLALGLAPAVFAVGPAYGYTMALAGLSGWVLGARGASHVSWSGVRAALRAVAERAWSLLAKPGAGYALAALGLVGTPALAASLGLLPWSALGVLGGLAAATFAGLMTIGLGFYLDNWSPPGWMGTLVYDLYHAFVDLLALGLILGGLAMIGAAALLLFGLELNAVVVLAQAIGWISGPI